VCEEDVLPPNNDTTAVDNPGINEVNVSSTVSQTSELSPEQFSGHTSTDSSRTVSKETETPGNRLTPQANAISKYLVQYISRKEESSRNQGNWVMCTYKLRRNHHVE